jgi:hypothetical protein
MAMAVLDHVPMHRIQADVRELHPGRALLTIIGGVLYLLGFLPAKAYYALLAAVAWSMAAVRVGWTDARHRPGGQRR